MFSILEVTPGTARSADYVDVFVCFEQCFPILEVTPGTAQTAEYVDFYVLCAIFSYP